MATELTEARQSVEELTAAVKALKRTAKVNRRIAITSVAALLASLGVGAHVYVQDQRDDKELACAMAAFGNEFTDAAVRANPEADPVVVEAFRRDLLSHLPPCED